MSASSRELSVGRAGDWLQVQVRPDCGLDLGAVHVGGTRVDWHGPAAMAGEPWLQRFNGGLLATCGLQNVGQPADGFGLHGDFTGVAATHLDVHEGRVTRVRGVVVDGPFECHRSIEVDLDRSVIRMRDLVTNNSVHRVQAPILYHVNWGAPFFSPTTVLTSPTIKGPSAGVREPWGLLGADTVVREYPLLDRANASVRLLNPTMELVAEMRWTGLHRLHQWVDMYGGSPVLAVEPSNCSVLGREHDRLSGAAPYLEPHARRATGLTVAFSRSPGFESSFV